MSEWTQARLSTVYRDCPTVSYCLLSPEPAAARTHGETEAWVSWQLTRGLPWWCLPSRLESAGSRMCPATRPWAGKQGSKPRAYLIRLWGKGQVCSCLRRAARRRCCAGDAPTAQKGTRGGRVTGAPQEEPRRAQPRRGQRQQPPDGPSRPTWAQGADPARSEAETGVPAGEGARPHSRLGPQPSCPGKLRLGAVEGGEGQREGWNSGFPQRKRETGWGWPGGAREPGNPTPSGLPGSPWGWAPAGQRGSWIRDGKSRKDLGPRPSPPQGRRREPGPTPEGPGNPVARRLSAVAPGSASLPPAPRPGASPGARSLRPPRLAVGGARGRVALARRGRGVSGRGLLTVGRAAVAGGGAGPIAP